MKITKTRKIQIAVCFIAVIAIACGVVYFLRDSSEGIIDSRVSDADYIYMGVKNLYSTVANRTENDNSQIAYTVEDEAKIDEIIKLCQNIEIIKPIESDENIYDHLASENDVWIEARIASSNSNDKDSEEKFFQYIILLGEKDTGCLYDVPAEEGKKPVYILTKRGYGYNTESGKGAEIAAAVQKQVETDPLGDPVYPTLFYAIETHPEQEYVYFPNEEEFGDQWKWCYYCQMDEEDYNALFDLQEDAAKSVLNIDK